MLLVLSFPFLLPADAVALRPIAYKTRAEDSYEQAFKRIKREIARLRMFSNLEGERKSVADICGYILHSAETEPRYVDAVCDAAIELSYDPDKNDCEINHAVTVGIGDACRAKPALVEIFAERIVGLLFREKKIDSRIGGGVEEVIDRINRAVYMGGGQNFSESLIRTAIQRGMDPMELRSRLAKHYDEYAHSGEGYRPLKSIFGTDIEIPGQPGEPKIYLRGYTRRWFFLESGGRSIGNVFLDYLPASPRLGLFIHISNYEDTRKGFGTRVARWAKDRLKDSATGGEIYSVYPIDARYIGFLIKCEEIGIFDTVEVQSSAEPYGPGVVALKEGWVKVNSLEDAERVRKPGESLTARGFVKPINVRSIDVSAESAI